MRWQADRFRRIRRTGRFICRLVFRSEAEGWMGASDDGLFQERLDFLRCASWRLELLQNLPPC